MSKLLIVDDDLHLRKLVQTYGEVEGFVCDEAASGQEAIDLLENKKYDLIILDVMMPGLDGFETLSHIRGDHQTPVIMLTARDEEYDKLFGFKLGADDYVSKPFSPKELMARVNAVLKRSKLLESDEMVFGSLRIQPASRVVKDDQKDFSLTPKEFDLLVYLARHEHLALSREQLLNHVWGYDYYGDIRTVDTHIKSLRDHIEGHREMIQTVWGVGYKFESL